MSTQGKTLKRKQLTFNGQWVPAGDPLLIGEQNYAQFKNMSYRNNGFPEAVNGYSKINTTALATYLKIRNGIHFINPLNGVSHVLVHAKDSDETAAAMLENITDIPDQGDFEAAVLHADASGAGLGRFSLWPRGTVAYCNGIESKVYSGDEMQCSGLINYSPAGDFSYDYSRIIKNLETDSNNIAVLRRVQETLGDDTVLLLHFDNSVDDSSPTTPHTVTNSNVTFSEAAKKFGSYGASFNGTNARLTIPDNTDFDFSGGNWAIDVWFQVHDFTDSMRGIFYQETEVFRLAFTGGLVEPEMGNILTGALSGATCRLLHTTVTSGSWGGGDAAGYFYVENVSGTFQAETLTVGGIDTATAGTIASWSKNYMSLRVMSSQYVSLLISTGYDTSEAVINLTSPAGELAADTLYHLEVGESGNDWYLFLNGTLKGSVTSSNRAQNYRSEVTIGRQVEGGNYFYGYMDELRVSSCTRHTEGFEVADDPYGSANHNTYFYAGFTRAIKGFKGYVQDANASTGDITVYYWDGEQWQAATGLTDGTKQYTVPLFKTGEVEFDTTVDLAKVKIINSTALYWYKIVISNADDDISLYHLTGNAPLQSVKDLWDGIFRLVYDFQVYNSEKFNDYTLNIAGADYSTANEATFVQIGELATTDYFLCGFEERMMALKVKIVGGSVNTNNAILTLEYWDGESWSAIDSLEDGTLQNGVSMAQSGTISWNPPASGNEFQREVNKGSPLYYYRLSFSAQLSSDVKIDRIYGVTAPKNVSERYTFPFLFQDRPMLCGYEGGREGNRVDYGATGSTEVFNGTDASAGAGAIYFGDNEPLTCACALYNRFGSSIYNLAVFCKKNQTFLLYGYNPETWKVYEISSKIGCPAPLTIDSAEIGYGVTEDVPRNVVVWLSYSGPVIFDGATILPIKDNIACYFDANDSRCINMDAIENARGRVDPEHNEYNLFIPSGVGQTECNVWLVIDLLRKKAYEKVPPATGYPQAAFRVMDNNGKQYVYGCLDTGYMMRLEHGNTWDGEELACVIRTADVIPTGDIWDYTKIHRVKFVTATLAEDEQVSVSIYIDGNALEKDLMNVDVAGINRHTRQVKQVNLQGWSYQFTFSLNQSIMAERFRPLAWGYQYEVIREDTTVDTDGLNKLAEQRMISHRAGD